MPRVSEIAVTQIFIRIVSKRKDDSLIATEFFRIRGITAHSVHKQIEDDKTTYILRLVTTGGESHLFYTSKAKIAEQFEQDIINAIIELDTNK